MCGRQEADLHCTDVPELHVAAAKAVEKRGERTLHHSAEGSGESLNPPCGDDVHCLSCRGLAQSWPQFVSYLSVSRINVNVRQVVSKEDVF